MPDLQPAATPATTSATAGRRRWPIRRMLSIAVTLLVLAAPVGSIVLLLGTAFDASIDDTMQLWTDELYYWHQTASMKTVGLQSGYYTNAEVPAPAGTSYYNWTGPVIPAFYALVTLPFGWGLSGMVWANLALVTGAVGLYLLMVRPGICGRLLLLLAVMIYPPFWLFAVSSQIPLLHMAIVIVLAGGFISLLRGERHPWVIVVTGLVLLFAGLVRMTWAPFLLGYAWLLMRHRPWSWKAGALLLAAAVMMLQVVAYQALSAPYPSPFIRSVSDGLRVSLGAGIAALWSNVRANIDLFNQGNTLAVYNRWQVLLAALVAVLWCLIMSVRRLRAARNPGHTDEHSQPHHTEDRQTGKRQQLRAEAAFHTLNLVMIVCFTIVIYDLRDWRDFRLLAPHLLLTLLVLLGCQRRAFSVLLLVSYIPALLFTTYVSNLWIDQHVAPAVRAEYETYRTQLADVVTYDADAPSRWCNTVLFSSEYWYEMTQLPLAFEPGIGLTSWTLKQPLNVSVPPQLPFRSRYLLFTDQDAASYDLPDSYMPVSAVPFGNIYINENVDCGQTDGP